MAVGSSDVSQPADNLSLILMGVAVGLLGLRLIVWMQESDHRMRALEQAVEAITKHKAQ